MKHDDFEQLDFGTGHKTLKVYSIGMVICIVLTVIAFHAVMSGQFSRLHTFIIIYSAAIAQFLVQVFFFLRLNINTKQGVVNMFAFIYTLVILVCIILGSLWIMSNLDYYMMY